MHNDYYNMLDIYDGNHRNSFPNQTMIIEWAIKNEQENILVTAAAHLKNKQSIEWCKVHNIDYYDRYFL